MLFVRCRRRFLQRDGLEESLKLIEVFWKDLSKRMPSPTRGSQVTAVARISRRSSSWSLKFEQVPMGNGKMVSDAAADEDRGRAVEGVP